MRLRIKILLILLAVFIAMQFYRPKRNNSEASSKNDITTAYQIPLEVQAILKNSCYDCHSNSTRYPWYTSIEPFGWWMDSHINEGKSELNFNEFGSYSARKQKSKLKAIGGSIEDGSMPLSSYTLIHQDAKLNDKEKKLLMGWLDQLNSTTSPKNK